MQNDTFIKILWQEGVKPFSLTLTHTQAHTQRIQLSKPIKQNMFENVCEMNILSRASLIPPSPRQRVYLVTLRLSNWVGIGGHLGIYACARAWSGNPLAPKAHVLVFCRASVAR